MNILINILLFLITTFTITSWAVSKQQPEVLNLYNNFNQMLALAEQGNAAAQNNIGSMYEGGDIVPQNYELALKWYQKAAENGSIVAQYNIGALYDFGNGVPRDVNQALKWYHLAAERGSVLAQMNLGVHYNEGKDFPQNYKQALYWYTKAAEQGDPKAQHNLAIMYEEGHGVRKNIKQAAVWYKKAAEQGLAEAQYNLGLMYLLSPHVIQNDTEVPNMDISLKAGEHHYSLAAYWFGKAAKQGYGDAQYNLAYLYELGLGVMKDSEQALYWYKKSAEQGVVEAKERLYTFRREKN